jgi:hypothetical protein
MAWTALFRSDFEREFYDLPVDVQDELLARLRKLEAFGPALGRPDVDTLKGSSFHNMKELRFQLDGVWRFAFAFDPKRNAIVLVGGNKQGRKQSRFYRGLIRVADARFAQHIAAIKS